MLDIQSGLLRLTEAKCLRRYSSQTVLDIASREGHKEVVSLLLDYGTGIQARERGERTAIHSAACR
jgi:ankyrin repeat protein